MSKSRFLGAVLPLILITVGVGLLFGLQPPKAEESKLPSNDEKGLMKQMQAANVASVRALNERLQISVGGTVVPYREIELAAEVAGKVLHKDPKVRSGNYVKKNQVLFRIDPRDYELEMERLTRKRDQEQALVAELELDIENSKLLLEVAEQELELAHDEVKRLESLNRNFSSAAELDQAKRSRLTSLNQRVNIQNQIRSQQTRKARLELAAKLAETELAQAELNRERTEIRSPVDGRIVSDQVEADSYVQRGTPLVVIEDTEKVEVACNIRMDQLHWILDQPALSTDQFVNAAQASRFELPPTEVEIRYHVAGRETFVCTWDGVLDRFDGAGLDPQSRTVPIRIRVDHPERMTTVNVSHMDDSGPPMLVRGMYVEAIVKAQPATNLFLVPKLGIKPASESSIIWKFVADKDAMYRTAMAKKIMKAAKENEGRDGSTNEKPAETESSTEDDFDPKEWVGGVLTIVEGVRMVSSYSNGTGDIDYWVCEVADGLSVGDQVVVTPLPALTAGEGAPIRVKKLSESDDGSATGTAEVMASKREERSQS